jgi:hypothetical protein
MNGLKMIFVNSKDLRGDPSAGIISALNFKRLRKLMQNVRTFRAPCKQTNSVTFNRQANYTD